MYGNMLDIRVSLVALFLAALFGVRACLFAGQYGGIEHDSSMHLSVAVNLVKHGKYATYKGMTADSASLSREIYGGAPALQDEDGFTYIPDIAVGPGYIFPLAFVIKVFGEGVWIYRTFPLLCYFSLLFVLFYLAGSWGSVVAPILLALWLWVYPPFHMIYAYEHLAEPTALLYFLLSALLFGKTNTRALVSGGLLALSVSTKLVMGFAVPAFAANFALGWYRRGASWPEKRVCVLWFVGFLVPTAIFQVYRATDLLSRFGVEAWIASNYGYLEKILDQATARRSEGVLSLLSLKLTIWRDTALSNEWMGWALLAGACAYLYRRRPVVARFAFSVVILYVLVSFAWFFFVYGSALTRHAWPAMMCGMLFISVAIGNGLQKVANTSSRKVAWGVAPLLALYAVTAFDIERMSLSLRFAPEIVDQWNKNHLDRGTPGVPPPILPFASQMEVIEFLSAHLKSDDRLFHTRYSASEIAPFIDRVFFQLLRYPELASLTKGRSLIIFSPYEMGGGRYQVTSAHYIQGAVRDFCGSILFANRYYTVCELKPPQSVSSLIGRHAYW